MPMHTARALIFTTLFFLLLGQSWAASFDIRPVRIFFDAGTKAEKLTIANGGDNDLTLQIKVYRWSQDSAGKDAYQETGDVVIFPRLLQLKKGEEKIVRIGLTAQPAAEEKTYRIYIEEIPQPRQNETVGSVRFITKAGVPLFVSPPKAEPRGKIDNFAMGDGKAEVTLRNVGNVHFAVRAFKLTGKNRKGDEVISRELGGWYLLAGAARPYTATIPREVCRDLASLQVEVVSDRLTLTETFNVTGSMCPP